MNNSQVSEIKKQIIATGRLLWDKGLVSGLNGNISVRVSDECIAMTGHKTCLGMLDEKGIVCVTPTGELIGDGKPSSERTLHLAIYVNFPQAKAIVHTHTPYINGYFLENERFTPRVFEAKLYLGEIVGVDQATPSVTDVAPVIEAFKKGNIVVLRNHGVIAMGAELMDAFFSIQLLEEAIQVDAISRLYRGGTNPAPVAQTEKTPASSSATGGAYTLFSQQQIEAIVAVVNADAQMKALGEKTQMTMDLAVKLNETGKVYSFHFEKGAITNVGSDESVEFVISASESVWRSVFKREIDPFVATTQKKMNLKGDFARISKWYAPCSRLFELWQKVPVV